jgi:hypothetical protein
MITSIKKNLSLSLGTLKVFIITMRFPAVLLTLIPVLCVLSICGSTLVLALQLKSGSFTRRSILTTACTETASACVACIILFPTRASAAVDMNNAQSQQESKATATLTKKPFAPAENLLPAIRVKQTIDKAITLTRSLLQQTPNSSSSKVDTLQQLESLLLQPQNYIQKGLKLQGVPAKPADLYLKSYKPLAGDLPLQRYLIQNGDVSTWKRLKKREKQLERSSEIRAALNAYTDALEFSGDSYLLNVDRATRSSMVREDRLPQVTQVITSDMGLRYLYRNQVLTAMDDVKAELEYQVQSSSSSSSQDRKGENSIDAKELLDLLLLANDAMDRWLSLIDAKDVQEAMEMALVAVE